jgi:hypothetical protein
VGDREVNNEFALHGIASRTGGMATKINRILPACAATMILQSVNVKLPLSNDSFGKMKGILNYCGKIDAGSSAKYQERAKLLAMDAPEKELTEARKSVHYLESYDSINADLEKEPMENSVPSCRAYLEGKQ